MLTCSLYLNLKTTTNGNLIFPDVKFNRKQVAAFRLLFFREQQLLAAFGSKDYLTGITTYAAKQKYN